jgi:hypothetical protein
MQKSTAPPGEDWRLGSGPFVFSGRPPMLVGDVELINTSEDIVKVRAIETAASRETVEALPDLGVLRLVARIAPGASTRARGHFLVDPLTPPGTYTAELDVAGKREQAVIKVLKDPKVEISPQRLRLAGAAGETVAEQVVVHNRGNVPQTVPEHGELCLAERDWIVRSLASALRESPEDEGHGPFLDRLVRQLRDTRARTVDLRIEGGRAELAPGELRELRIVLELPEGLPAGRTYFGRFPFLGRILLFEVSSEGAPTRKRRP